MSQHDFNIANQTFPSFRSDLNDALQAAATISAGATAPTTPYAYQLWFDTSTNTYKARNAANSSWISLFGTDLTNGGITFGDNDKAIFGAGSDLQIYHDGSNSIIDDTGDGRLYLRSDPGVIISKYTGETCAQFNADADVKLYYDNAEKLATTATGIDVTGTVTADGLTVDGNGTATITTSLQNPLRLTSSTGYSRLQLDNSADVDAYSGVASTGQALFFETAATERMRITSAGKIGINTSSPTGILEINGSNNALLAFRTTGDAAQQVMGTQYLNNSGAVTAQTFATGDSSSSSVFRIKAIGAIDLIGGDVGVTGAAADLRVAADGNVSVANDLAVTGSVSKGSGSFKIDHPLPSKKDTHDLVHSFIEGPQADLIYRGRATLSGGTVDVNVDTAAGMTEGTFVLLCNNVQCFTSNEEGWTALRGSVTGNVLTITAQDNTCTDTVSWMVIGERKDTHMLDTEWTDENGKVIVEPTKVTS